jgi:autotransporter translocation and assembly factor TamB
MKVSDAVGGALEVKWTGEGELDPAAHRGEGSVAFTKGRYGKFDLQEVHVGGRYTEKTADADIRAKVGATRLDTTVEWREQRLALPSLELHQGEQRALTGKIVTRLPAAGERVDPMKLPIEINLDADKLDIEKLMTSLGQSAPAGGQLSIHCFATGTVSRPEIELTVQGRALKATAVAKVEPADADIKLSYHPGELKLNAVARQPLVQPITVNANVPLDLERVIEDKKLPADLPLEATVKLPTTSLAAVPKFVPQVRRVDGTAAIDLTVRGTVEKPELSGDAVISLRDARMVQEGIPAIGQFDARIAFAKNALSFERFRGQVGGGTFELLGNIQLTRLDEPVFDLHAKAAQVLVKRDDSVTVRADADVKVGGSLHEGSLTGDIFITQSRFFKEIDILPIGLPGRPKPEPKSVPAEPDINLPPPLDKWKIDIGIKTRDQDPFMIRGNLANGEVGVNLRLANDGPKPWLEGTVTLNRFVGSLPFSRLTVDDGHIYFGKTTPINQPTLDIRAVSKIREYTVTAYIFGNAQAPTIQFVSEPPLPHADIVALIATGTTSSELAGSADVLASRAAMLAAQSLWKKVFKPKASTAAAPASQQGDTAGFMERFDLALGGADIKTGAREATAQFKVNEQIYIVGELDTQGRYTGALKYLLRFR